MYCRNCGFQMADQAVVCVKCGVPVEKGENYCPHCGADTLPGAEFCTACGAGLPKVYPEGVQKSKLAAGLLGIFLGGLGIHNFYLGYTGKAIAQIVLSFCFGIGAIWGLIDGILILAGNINKDAAGIPLKD